MKRLLSCGLAAALLGLVPGVAAAQRVDARQDAPLVRVSGGLRGQWYGSEGLDPFSTSDFAPQGTLAADVTLLRHRSLSLAAGVSWDFGNKSGEARNVETRLFVHRVTIPLEGRWHWTRGIYAFARVAPGFTASLARISSLEYDVGPYRDTRYAFAADLSAGVAFALSPPSRYRGTRSVRLWAVPEIGYGLAGKTSFALRPPGERPDGDVLLPGTTAATRLPGFSPSGPFFRISLALAF